MKLRFGAVTALLILAALVLWGTGWHSGSAAASFSTQEALATASEGPVPEHELSEVHCLHVDQGRTPMGILLEAGVERNQAQPALDALSDLISLRTLRPSDDVYIYRSRQGDLVRLELQRTPRSKLVVQATTQGYNSERITFPTETVVRRLRGQVESSLYAAMIDEGGNQGLLVAFADLFAWDFDFATDTRAGDRFELLVREERLNGQRLGSGTVLAGSYHPAGNDEPYTAYRFEAGETSGYYDARGRSIRRMFLKSPLNYSRISSGYSHSRMHPILKKRRPHLGVDYAAPMGTPVVSIGNGSVAKAGWIGGYGKTVQIKHNGTYLTQYAHLSRYAKGVRAGSRVKQNQIIGYVGNTGMSTGPHLDFRVKENGRWINPLRIKGGRSEPLPKGRLPEFGQWVDSLNGLLETLEPGVAVAADVLQVEDAPALASRVDTPGGS